MESGIGRHTDRIIPLSLAALFWGKTVTFYFFSYNSTMYDADMLVCALFNVPFYPLLSPINSTTTATTSRHWVPVKYFVTVHNDPVPELWELRVIFNVLYYVIIKTYRMVRYIVPLEKGTTQIRPE